MTEQLDRLLGDVVRNLAHEVRAADLARVRSPGADASGDGAGGPARARPLWPSRSRSLSRPWWPARGRATRSRVRPSPCPVWIPRRRRMARSAGNRPVALPGGFVLTGLTSQGTPRRTSWVLDRARGYYVKLSQYESAFPAPRGPYVAVITAGGLSRIGIIDLRDGDLRWFDGDGWFGTPQWTSDGARLLISAFATDDSGSMAFDIIDVDTGQIRRHEVDQINHRCTDWCMFTWMPDGAEVALPQTDTNVAHSEAEMDPRRGLQLFDADNGRPTRLLPIRGDIWSALSWSPDGRHVVVQGVTEESPRRYQTQLVDARTGSVVRTFPTHVAYWIDNGRLLYLGVRGLVCAGHGTAPSRPAGPGTRMVPSGSAGSPSGVRRGTSVTGRGVPLDGRPRSPAHVRRGSRRPAGDLVSDRIRGHLPHPGPGGNALPEIPVAAVVDRRRPRPARFVHQLMTRQP